MHRTTPILLAVLVAVGTVGVAPALGMVPASSDVAQETATNETDSNASVSPGERFSAAVGVQETELDGEIDSRSFGLAVARAGSDEARAALIAEKVNRTNAELDDLAEKRQALREAKQNGSMSQGEYRARIAELNAETENVERAANDSANASQGIPTDLLESKGVNATAIQTLRDSARNLSGGEVAEIARSIAGDSKGRQAEAGDRGNNNRPDQADRRGGDGQSTSTETAPDSDEDESTTADADQELTTDTATDSTGDERPGNAGGR